MDSQHKYTDQNRHSRPTDHTPHSTHARSTSFSSETTAGVACVPLGTFSRGENAFDPSLFLFGFIAGLLLGPVGLFFLLIPSVRYGKKNSFLIGWIVGFLFLIITVVSILVLFLNRGYVPGRPVIVVPS